MYICIYIRKKIEMAAEKNFENKVKNYLTNNNIWFIKYWAGAKFTKEGIPDILACYKGRFLAIELKAPKGKPSVLQLVTLRQIRNAGGYGVLLYPDDFTGFKKWMENLKDKSWYDGNIEKQDRWFSKLDA